MIGQIHGIILEKQPPQLMVNVQGVGYEIDASMNTFYQLPDVGERTTLFTHLIIREDAHHLYGFYTKTERLLFRALLKVNGVGPRLALTILSAASPEEFVRLVLHHDTASLIRLPGVGKKTAERLVIEMRDKLSNWFQNPPEPSSQFSSDTLRHQILQDAMSALVTLGFKQPEANRVVVKMDDGKASSEELIRQALKELN